MAQDDELDEGVLMIDGESSCGWKDNPPFLNGVEMRVSSFSSCNGMDKPCIFSERILSVNTSATDTEGDVITYTYEVSDGKIIGRGPRVEWDLSGRQPGTYTLSVCVDDGLGCLPETTKIFVVELIGPPISKKDPHGFIGGPIGRIDRRPALPNKPARVFSLTADKSGVLWCSNDCGDSSSVALSVAADDPEGDVIVYNYSVNGGKIIGQGYRVVWDLSGVKAGEYEVKVCADDGAGCEGESRWKSLSVSVW